MCEALLQARLQRVVVGITDGGNVADGTDDVPTIPEVVRKIRALAGRVLATGWNGRATSRIKTWILLDAEKLAVAEGPHIAQRRDHATAKLALNGKVEVFGIGNINVRIVDTYGERFEAPKIRVRPRTIGEDIRH